MKIKIFAPVDGTIKNIEQSNDSFFAKKNLGEGLVIIPKNNSFFSPFDQAKVSLIAKTKHAIYFEVMNSIYGLMHIGLDSLKLEGKPFDLKVNAGDFVDNNTLVENVNFEEFTQQNLSVETVIFFETVENLEFKINILKTEAKQGDLIAELEIEQLTKPAVIETKSNLKNKYLQIAYELLTIVGVDNINQLQNCVTRVRFHVINSTLVDEQAIRKIELVKGINWNGNELQVIFGPEAFRVKDKIEDLMKGNQINFKTENSEKALIKKQRLGQRFIAAANGIIVPLIPLFIAAGFISGIASLLAAPSINVIDGALGEGKFVTDMDLMSGLMYILSNSGITLLSIFFCYSTVKYFKGNPVLGILIGLLISSRYFLRSFDDTYTLINGDWFFYKNDTFEFGIKSYNNSVIPAIGAALTYVYLDRFIKKWMPSALDMALRPVLAVVGTFFIAFFAVLPLLGLVEYAMIVVTTWFFEWPIGIGRILIGLLYQPMNLVGLSWPVLLAIEYPWVHDGAPMRTQNILDVSTISLIGVMIALYIKQNKVSEKKTLVSLTGPLVFGIPEPVIFATLIKKPKVFWLSNFGSAILGLILYYVDITRWDWGGTGFLGVFGFGDNYLSILLFIAIGFFGIALNFLLVFFFYNEKKSETKLVKKTLRFLTNYTWIFNRKRVKNGELKSNIAWIELHKELQEIIEDSKENKTINSSYRQLYLKYSKLLNKILMNNERFETKQNKLITKIAQAKNETKKVHLELLLKNLKEKHHQRLELSLQVEELQKILELNRKNLTISNDKIFNKSQKTINQFLEKYHATDYEQEILNKLWNDLNDNLITSGYLESKPVDISKEQFYQTNNKYLLKVLPKNF